MAKKNPPDCTAGCQGYQPRQRHPVGGPAQAGDPNLFAREYYEQGIDELLYIDIVASLYNRNNLSDIVRKTVDDVYIPVCVGGGLRSVEDVRHILSMGRIRLPSTRRPSNARS